MPRAKLHVLILSLSAVSNFNYLSLQFTEKQHQN